MLVRAKGKGWWRLDYRIAGKRKTLSMGVYPDVSLSAARDRRNEARKLIAAKIDPATVRHAERESKTGRNTFETVAREWHTKQTRKWSANHGERTKRRLEKDLFPWLGGQTITAITPTLVLKTVQRTEQRGAIESAHRALSICSQIFRYAVATGRADSDPCRDLKGALSSVDVSHHPSITNPKEIRKLLQAIESYKGGLETRCALKLAPLVFVRPGELRHAEWSEIDFEKREWRIPATKMKAGRVHIVPLSNQAIDIVKELAPLTGNGKYLFPSVRSPARPMSENTINAALRRMGYTRDEMTAHGFRSMASTLLNEQGYKFDVIERQLAHAEGNSVRAAYNYAEYLPERKQMMQDWADFLGGLK